ncbi:hypothetical protein ACFYKX_11725 [Cytobacillus sp. FJAT-54145]|uniref:Uncharacterized protein n=1 Tax=Cytobacillus spartinae TaxID=3299023 RepID=A0ABW6K9P5_9BACI
MLHFEKIKQDHTKKSNQVKRLRKKLKKKSQSSLPLSVLEDVLKREERTPIDHREYFYSGDDGAYTRDAARKEARIQLLKELINEVKRK